MRKTKIAMRVFEAACILFVVWSIMWISFESFSLSPWVMGISNVLMIVDILLIVIWLIFVAKGA